MAKHNVFRDGRVHVLSEECATCIFKPATRPVLGARVAEMVRDTMAEDGATVVCHSTLFESDPSEQENAICRGWFDRFADKDAIMRRARAFDIITEVPPPTKPAS